MQTPGQRADPSRIIRVSEICGGEPIVAGTRVPVRSIVVQWRHYNDIECVRAAFPRVDARAIQDALDFCGANQLEIDRLIEENEWAASLPN